MHIKELAIKSKEKKTNNDNNTAAMVLASNDTKLTHRKNIKKRCLNLENSHYISISAIAYV